MKMSKTIIPALAMLVVSAVMLTTASLAWFAMNNQVSATNMSVNIKSDSMFLYIAAAPDDTTEYRSQDVITNGGTSANGIPIGYESTGSTENKVYLTDIYPSAYDRETIDTLDALNTPSNWYTASALAPGASAIDNTTKEALGDFKGYVVRYKYYLTLSEGSNSISKLAITDFELSMKVGGENKVLPVKVVIASDAGIEELKYGSTGTSQNFNLLSQTLVENEVACFYLFVYYDGNEDSVYTNNIDNIDSASISFKVSVPNN